MCSESGDYCRAQKSCRYQFVKLPVHETRCAGGSCAELLAVPRRSAGEGGEKQPKTEGKRIKINKSCIPQRASSKGREGLCLICVSVGVWAVDTHVLLDGSAEAVQRANRGGNLSAAY